MEGRWGLRGLEMGSERNMILGAVIRVARGRTAQGTASLSQQAYEMSRL